jgi:hypothetical protein
MPLDEQLAMDRGKVQIGAQLAAAGGPGCGAATVVHIYELSNFALLWRKAAVFKCDPVLRAWDPCYARCTRTNTPTLGIVLNVFNLITDLVLLLLPIRVVLRLQMNKRKKCTSSFSLSPSSHCSLSRHLSS